MPFKTLIVDDEPLAREGLRMLLSEDADVGAIEEAKNGREAIVAIRTTPPDLIFLDVQMPEVDGFAVVREIGAERMPAVVFVTAHDRYALQAFEINAIDYLLHIALSALEKSLDPETFLRIHRSIIVNVRRIKELEPVAHGEYIVTLHNDVRLRSGRTYCDKLKALADNPF